MTFERKIDDTWDFAMANTKEYTHCYHNYPAMMIPQIARRLITTYKTADTKLLFDPYCGSGTSLVEAKLQGINSIGTDLNPMARIISKAKTTVYNIEMLREARNNLTQKIMYEYNPKETFQTPDFQNIDYWFSKLVIHKLSFLKHIIFNEINHSVRNFFLIPFSETVREASYTRNSEFKLYRIQEEKLDTFNVNPFELFIRKVERNFNGYLSFHKDVNKEIYADVYDFNTCDEIPDKLLNEKVNLIVTSPPYGDSSTTVAYGQFSRLSNQWFDIEDAAQIDRNLMGGKKRKIENLKINSAAIELSRIKAIDEKRYNEVNLFLFDYKNSIDNVSRIVGKGGTVCYVVGNRTVKGVQIPLDYITAEFFENNGFELQEITIRRIPSKRMPSKNSPTNEVGKLVTTMNHEYIVILKKL